MTYHFESAYWFMTTAVFGLSGRGPLLNVLKIHLVLAPVSKRPPAREREKKREREGGTEKEREREREREKRERE